MTFRNKRLLCGSTGNLYLECDVGYNHDLVVATFLYVMLSMLVADFLAVVCTISFKPSRLEENFREFLWLSLRDVNQF